MLQRILPVPNKTLGIPLAPPGSALHGRSGRATLWVRREEKSPKAVCTAYVPRSCTADFGAWVTVRNDLWTDGVAVLRQIETGELSHFTRHDDPAASSNT